MISRAASRVSATVASGWARHHARTCRSHSCEAESVMAETARP